MSVADPQPEEIVMPVLDLEKLRPDAVERIRPFLEEILSKYMDKVHSLHITGSCITEDFDPKVSDVNSIVALKEMDLKFLELLAPLGRKYGKHRVAAPLIMTPEYIKRSLDVFPIEFMNFKLIHKTVFGEDIFENIEIKRVDLRHQCERELKVKLIWLRQGYISSQGDRKVLTRRFAESISGYIPLFRSIIVILDKAPPVRQSDVIKAMAEAAGINTDVFARVLRVKHDKIKLSLDELNTIFEDYYSATERLGKIVDEINL
jgi:hypothetical protein